MFDTLNPLVAHYHACYYSHNLASMQLVTIVNHLL
jgi:hypothetical protein